MTNLLELSKRVEGLNGPSREMDAEIAIAVRYGMFEHHWFWTFEGPFIAHMDGSIQQGKYGSRLDTPKLTASLDASTTLIPEHWVIESANSWPDAGVAFIQLAETHKMNDGQYAHGSKDGRVTSTAATETLARCAAALRAIHRGE